ncbi:alcohol dehydrogenase catalytic domain-containing protein [Nocardia jiangxiensis]|uniref:alcohol dehydrogenase catalytic domain-containing protein n=1 Tax=Nocardia jiangxiensis TaxID=282685 RepID=UPI00059362F4|nr:alcohol dehydrogenase catalytic domain-containing protein [Nocardia jiangxiensis]
MRAVVFTDRNSVQVTEVPDPRLIDPTDALVRVRRAAICGTDLHTIAHPDHLPPGTVLGHEYTGDIVALGSAVQRFAVGERVSGADFTACGTCWWCRSAQHWQCTARKFFGTGTTFGPALAGAQAELVRVPFADTVLAPIPDDLTYDAALFFGDVLATGFAAFQRAATRPGDTVVVIGGGPVGQLASLCAQACGAGPVVLVEPVQQRRDIAEAHGAVTATPDTARSVVHALSDGHGADAVLEAVGGPVGLDTAFGLVRAGGTIVSVGVHAQPSYPLPVARAFTNELTVRFAVGDAMRDRDRLTGLVRSGAIDPTVIIDRRAPLEDAPAAYADMRERRSLKAVLDIG